MGRCKDDCHQGNPENEIAQHGILKNQKAQSTAYVKNMAYNASLWSVILLQCNCQPQDTVLSTEYVRDGNRSFLGADVAPVNLYDVLVGTW